MHILIYSPINESNITVDVKKETPKLAPKLKETNKLDSLFQSEVKRTHKNLETEQKIYSVLPAQQGRKY